MATQKKTAVTKRPTVGDYVRYKTDEESGVGLIVWDDKDSRPYRVYNSKKEDTSYWLREDEVKIIPKPKSFAIKNNTPLPISDNYTARFIDNDTLKVGCQFIIQDAVLLLADEIKRRRASKSKKTKPVK